MGNHSQHGYGRKKWWDDQSIIPGVTKNGLIFAVIFAVLFVIYLSFNWDQIVTFW